VFRFIPDASARIAALLSGQADLIDKVPAINTAAIEGNPGYRVDTASGTRIYYLSIAYPDGPTADVRVRQAISHAIDTQLIIDKLLLGRGRQIAAPVSDTTFGYDPELAPYAYDPE
jgi:peptide/nickel transport system substrate-binding protein